MGTWVLVFLEPRDGISDGRFLPGDPRLKQQVQSVHAPRDTGRPEWVIMREASRPCSSEDKVVE